MKKPLDKEFPRADFLRLLESSAWLEALRPRVHFLLRKRRGLSPIDADDVLAETILTYLRVHSRYPPKDNHFKIFWGILRKKELEHIERAGREKILQARFGDHLLHENPDRAAGRDIAHDPFLYLVAEEDRALIRRVLFSLPEPKRTLLFRAARWAGNRGAQKAYADKLGIPLGTFHTQIRSARLALLKLLDPGKLASPP